MPVLPKMKLHASYISATMALIGDFRNGQNTLRNGVASGDFQAG